jgi:hypothetical protein
MTTKPKAREAAAATMRSCYRIDPVFTAIAEHEAKAKESNRLEAAARAARDKAEKTHGEWIEHIRRCRSENRSEDGWPGEAIVSPFYDRWNRAGRAERKAAIRMARTTPTTPSGMAALISHVQRALKTDREVDWQDWVPLALKSAASALARMEAA